MRFTDRIETAVLLDIYYGGKHHYERRRISHYSRTASTSVLPEGITASPAVSLSSIDDYIPCAQIQRPTDLPKERQEEQPPKPPRKRRQAHSSTITIGEWSETKTNFAEFSSLNREKALM